MIGARGFARAAGRPRIISHRGVLDDGAIENTLPAFEAAARAGADAIELDVRTCATGELVLMHDPTLERVTGGADTRAVAEMSLADLAHVELPGGARVPALTEALALARAHGLAVNVELKRDVPSRGAVVSAAGRLLRAWDPRHPILVSSFDPPMLAGLRAIAPAVQVAILVEPKWYRYTSRMTWPVGAAAIHVERTLTFPPEIEAFKARGLLVNVWTINDPEEARDLAALGVDGLITDQPAAMRAAVAADASFP